MTKNRNISDLLDANGDVKSGALDNVPASNDASALTTGTLPIARIADGDVATAKIADGAVTSAKLASGVGGKVLQVVSTTKTDTFTTTSTSFTDVTGLTVAITPSSTSSKILVLMNSSVGNSGGTWVTQIRLLRESTSISIGDAAGSRGRVTGHSRTGDNAETQNISISFLDTPSSTSEQTYKVQMYAQGNTAVLNRTGVDTDAAHFGRTASTITVMEIAG